MGGCSMQRIDQEEGGAGNLVAVKGMRGALSTGRFGKFGNFFGVIHRRGGVQKSRKPVVR